MSLPSGPYRIIQGRPGEEIPLYIISFDKQGACQSPRTAEDLFQAATTGEYSDLFLFSHGWNNDWPTAVGAYEDFIKGFTGLRQAMSLPLSPAYKPLLVGIFWPSTALVFGNERGPSMAAEVARGRNSADAAASVNSANPLRRQTPQS